MLCFYLSIYYQLMKKPQLNKVLFSGLLFSALSALSLFCAAQSKKSRVRPVLPYHHATLNAPPNMVYIRGGSTTIKYNQSVTDTNNARKVSLTSFFIDKTEVTNSQYRLFTQWVIDSIAIYKYLDDESYFLGYKGDSSTSVSTINKTATDTTTKEIVVAAVPPPVIPAVADSEITYDSVIVDNTPAPAVKEDVKELFNKALKGITFETSKDVIRPTSFPVLDQVVNALKENPTYNIQINGHTDNQGKAQANQVLSQKRANSVKNYLVSKGIDGNRIRTAGYGGERPIADNTTPEGREQNRRVEFIADIPPTASGSTGAATAGNTKRTRTIKVKRMVMRSVNISNTTDTDSDTTKGFAPGKRRINWAMVNHKKIFSNANRRKLAPLLDENGEIRKDKYLFRYTYQKTQNTAASAKPKNGQTVREVINIFPDENVWAEDMTNSQTDLLVENYFKIGPYDDYPVVGVTWRQARAYCYWRSITAANYDDMPDFMKYYHLTYTLPTEAQWNYAASGYYDMIRSNMDTASADTTGAAALIAKADSMTTVTPHDSAYVAAVVAQSKAKTAAAKEQAATPDAIAEAPIIDSTPIHKDEKGLLANFKQDEGDYWEDGGALTLPVMAYAPNEFGLYNMEGNVSEWMLDAYSPSAWAFISDLNPALQYDADENDADAMKRKVIRGGSFMSNAKALGPNFRDLELENTPHCFIGFRCVVMAPEVLYRPVQTRKKRVSGHSATKLAGRR
jgi:outer membrane protein OmpA-like peptidoglycan-associated protein/formylglycine-generating enzyme required for sulfatase activity